jgi:uncharacterized protein with HEPN domain
MRDDRERLQDIVDAIAQIERYAPARKEDFLENELVQVWIIHHLQVIGEAASSLSSELRSCTPDIPWQAVIGLRNILVHAYFRVDPDELWAVVEKDIPFLKKRVGEILEDLSP